MVEQRILQFGKSWKIGIQNPFGPGAINRVSLAGQNALLTSGNYQRYYQQADKIVHHMIDPRTGEPSKHISSATVLSDPVLSDVAVTTLMIDGTKDYLIVNEDKEIIITRSFAQKIGITSDWPVVVID